MIRYLVLTFIGASLGGCGELPAPPRPEPEEFVPPEEPEEPGGVGVGEGQPPPRPSLESVPEATGHLSVPVSGQTGPFAAVVVEGGRGTSFDDADSTGFFCVDVALRSGETQTLSVYAQDDEGRASEMVEVTVTHDPTMGAESVEEESNPSESVVSVVESGVTQVYGSTRPNAGSFASLVDNDPSTVLEIEDSLVSIDLGALFDVTEIEITFPDAFGVGDDQYATDYSVLTSANDAASVPTAWDELRVVDAMGGGLGDGGEELFSLEQATEIRWVGVELRENAVGFDPLSETFRLADVRVFARIVDTPEPQPGPQAPRCAGGQ